MVGGTIKEVCKQSKGNMFKVLVHSIQWSILVMKLALWDERICKYLLYSLLPIKFTMGKPLILPHALLVQTETNEDWAK